MKLFVLLLLFPLCAMADATSDFAARCNGPGVIVCNGFDSSGDLAEGSIQQAYDDTDQFALNTDQKASGASSLRATFRSGVNSTNIGGAWSMNLPQTFDAGDTLYVQVRFRVTQAYITNNADYWGDSSIKLMNIHGDSSTCQGSEFTTTYGQGWFGAYTSCGVSFKTGTASTAMVTSCPEIACYKTARRSPMERTSAITATTSPSRRAMETAMAVSTRPMTSGTRSTNG